LRYCIPAFRTIGTEVERGLIVRGLVAINRNLIALEAAARNGGTQHFSDLGRMRRGLEAWH
jgi:hypothetical protein